MFLKHTICLLLSSFPPLLLQNSPTDETLYQCQQPPSHYRGFVDSNFQGSLNWNNPLCIVPLMLKLSCLCWDQSCSLCCMCQNVIVVKHPAWQHEGICFKQDGWTVRYSSCFPVTSDWSTDIAVTECFIPLFYESIFHMNVCISVALSMCLSRECLREV